MRGAKGSKMPRGDKEQIMRYELPVFSPQEQENIGNIVISITEKLRLNRAINHNLATPDRSSTRAKGSRVAWRVSLFLLNLHREVR